MAMPPALQLQSDRPLDLPPICACCGKVTKRTIKLVAESPDGRGAETILGCLGALIIALAHLIVLEFIHSSKKECCIPFCRRCHLDYLLPAPLPTETSFMRFVCPARCRLFYLIARRLSRRAWDSACLPYASFCCSSLPRKTPAMNGASMPIGVQYDGARYRYLVWSGPYVEYFRVYPGADREKLNRDFFSRWRAQDSGAVEI